MAEECAAKILAAINQVFKADFAETCLVPGQSVMHGGALNVVLYVPDLPETPRNVATFNAVAPGRYALDGWRCYLYGGGRHLHIPSSGETSSCCAPVAFEKLNVGGKLSLRFTAHIDNGYPYNPAGFVYHVVSDVILSGRRNPCP